MFQLWNSPIKKFKNKTKNKRAKKNPLPPNNKCIKHTNQTWKKCSLLTLQHNHIKISFICCAISVRYTPREKKQHRHLSLLQPDTKCTFQCFTLSSPVLTAVRKECMKYEGRFFWCWVEWCLTRQFWTKATTLYSIVSLLQSLVLDMAWKKYDGTKTVQTTHLEILTVKCSEFYKLFVHWCTAEPISTTSELKSACFWHIDWPLRGSNRFFFCGQKFALVQWFFPKAQQQTHSSRTTPS